MEARFVLTLSGKNNIKVEEPFHDGMQAIRFCKKNLLFLRREIFNARSEIFGLRCEGLHSVHMFDAMK